MKKLLSITSILILALVLWGCTISDSKSDDLKVSKSEFMLDTVITLTLYGTDDDSAIDEIFNTISELEDKLSIHEEGSELALIRDNAGIKPVAVSNDTLAIFEKSVEYSNLSGGLFDITAAPLISLWAIGTEEQRVPSHEEIKAALELIGYEKIVINHDESTVYIEGKGMYANLGAIAKGYIADKAAEKAKELGVDSAILNLGGNVLLIGSKPDGSNFKVGIQDPDEPTGGYMGIVEGRNLSIVTSGDYERYFIEDGVKYHHILNPYTGYPVDSNIKSVSIITENSFDGDALSTSVLLMGLEKGLEFIEAKENTDAIFITKDNEIILTDGAQEIFQLKSEKYSFKE
ncbi:thiamine biosynthesis lipoprotein [Dethiosulfatibacter aminovorans DSM 17477]|uniref:FAD:protein FMN transferase n=1 Tax=Dethiosulfatibacter aminovorans DSM 17477 TaxID=1121476 RepID=A0A1M6FTJ9_9FIRM|nr:FAD:protein FMN transferase [Dethiosulfatibacter aminovorans]SHJ01008.1 thiamine biosynthesis lipoprotein [Dethiosulfatibacter aminovorans DSM 17477]